MYMEWRDGYNGKFHWLVEGDNYYPCVLSIHLKDDGYWYITHDTLESSEFLVGPFPSCDSAKVAYLILREGYAR